MHEVINKNMKKLPKKILTYFLQGLLALLPVIVTGYVIVFLFKIVKNTVDNALVFIPWEYRGYKLITFSTEVAAALALFVFIVGFGILIRTLIGRKAVKYIDSFFSSLPGLKAIYKITKQVVELVRGDKKKFFTHPVLAEYPSPGIWAIAFRTGEIGPMLSGASQQKHYTVFIPTTPNPTSGFLAILPSDKIKEVDLSAEEAVKMILTGGMVK